MIDSHIHFGDPSRLAELERYCGQIGADRIGVLSLPVRKRINFNPEVLFAKARLGQRCCALGSFDFSDLFYPQQAPGKAAGRLDLAAQVRSLWNLGFEGLKIFAGKPGFQRQLGLKLNGPLFLEALQEAERLSLPAVIHVADPPVFWSADKLSGYRPPLWSEEGRGGDALPGYEELQSQALAVLDACPRLIVIFPHLLMMAHDLPRLARILEAHDYAYLDLAPGLYFYGELDRERGAAREFFRTFRDRILFGSDGLWFSGHFAELPPFDFSQNLRRARFLLRFLQTGEAMDNPFEPTRRARPRVRGLELEQEALDAICRGNFLRLFSPRPIHRSACLEYLRDFLARLEAIGAEPVDRDAVQAVYRELALGGSEG